VHRIGQMRGVQVFRLITKGTLEERIDQIKESATGIQKDRLDPGTQAIYGDFDAALQSYIKFTLDNLPAIQVVQLDDSVEFNRVRNLLVVDLNDNFLV